MVSFRTFLMSLMLFCMAALSAQAAQTSVTPKDSNRIAVFESTEDLRESLEKKPSLQFGSARSSGLTIEVNDATKYQQMDGFGASLTDSSAWLISKKLSEAQRKELLETLFGPKKGIGLSVLRQPMGASDFGLEHYSYDDLPAGKSDPELHHFSIAHDRAYILPILREALALNPHLKIIATPWSPPGWMKSSGSLLEGTLLPSAYAPLAQYFVKFVQSYKAAGVPIYAVTMQNEPLNIPKDYPGMGMSASEQAAFLREYLGPAFQAAKLNTKIMIFDHNWDLIDFPIAVMSDAKAASFAAGIATHCYGGRWTAQSSLHDRFPDKDIWETECSGGEWQKGRLLEQAARLIIGSTRNWAKSVVLWNLALDQNHGPYKGGCDKCRAVVTINDSESPATSSFTVDYVGLAHASKFIVPGAHRVDSNSFEEGSLEDVAFRNPDGSIVLIVLNGGSAPISFNIGWRGHYASYTLDGGAVATFVWSAGRNSR